jgi:2,3-bisphosphoglycerate-independent phosphoglycerate mutase
MKKLIFIFLDGVGIGKPESNNPFFRANAEFLPLYKTGCILPDGNPIKAIDACMEVQGMPMSATGQTSLFSGMNIPAYVNEHRNSYPDIELRKIIKKKNLFSMLRKNRLNPSFLNAFPYASELFSPYHISIEDNGDFRFSDEFRAQVRRTLSVTTCMMITNYMRPFGKKDILQKRALFHDFTNITLNQKGVGPPIPQFSPEDAAEIIYNASRNYDFILYEYFLTDLYGHGFEMIDCIELIQQLNLLIKHLISLLDPKSDTLLITSDHGNLEDASTQLHTYNPALLLTSGYHSKELRDNIQNLADVTPAILEQFKNLS